MVVMMFFERAINENITTFRSILKIKYFHHWGLSLVFIFGLSTIAAPSLSSELIITNPKKSSLDMRFEYPIKVLNLALEKTQDEYGTFAVEPYPQPLTRKRALILLGKGDISVFSAPTRTEWEEKALPVRIPIRKGLMGYRLFLIRAENQKLFSNIQSVDDLKQLRVGQGLQWSTTAALKKLGFTIDGSSDYEALFTMLMHDRFDYFPRSITEIFTELDMRKDKYPDMRIEDTMSLYLPLPYYFFVTPKRPDLARRIEAGLQLMIRDGSLNALFYDYHRDSIERAKLDGRRILRMENKDLTPLTPFDEKQLWYQPE